MALSGSLARFNRDAAALIARQPDPPRSVDPRLAVLQFRAQLLFVVILLTVYVIFSLATHSAF